MHNINVVEMKLEHIDGIMQVENLSFTIPWSKKAFLEEISNTLVSRYLVAESNDKIIGYGGFWKVLEEGHITNIAVIPEFRGNGIGGILLQELIILAKKEEIKSMTLEVRSSNKAAQALYSKFGFVGEGSRKAYYADTGEDALIMWKYDI